MSSKFLISSDSISWTLAKPAMLVVAAVGGISGHTGQERAPAPSRPLAPAWAGAPRGASLGLAAPVVQPIAAMPVSVPGIRRAAPAVPQAHAPSGGFVQAFPEPAEPGAAPEIEPMAEPAQFALTTWGTITPVVQQTLAPASTSTAAVVAETITDAASANGTDFVAPPSDLKLPQSASAAIAVPGIQFIAVPVVQPIPEAAKAQTAEANSELILGTVRQVPPAPAARAAPAGKVALAARPARITPAPAKLAGVEADAPAMASSGAAAPIKAQSPVKAQAPAFAQAPAIKPAGSGTKAYTLKDGIIEYALAARVNGVTAGPLALRITPDNRLWLRLGDLIGLVRAKMTPAEFARFSESTRAAEYVEFDTIRRAGIDLSYDASRNQITVGLE